MKRHTILSVLAKSCDAPAIAQMSGDREYDTLAGWAAILAGVGGFVYSVAFIFGVVLGKAPDLGRSVSSAALAIGGLLTAVVAVGLFQRARESSPPAALLGAAFALFGSMGATIHGTYDLANVLHPPISDVFSSNELPNPVDPRGVLTFAAAGIGLLILVWLVRRTGTLQNWIGSLGMVVGVLLILIYLGRLIILSPTNPLVAGLAGLTGFILSPVFYIGLGLWLRSRATL
jgi:hypothetical protein